MGKKRILVVGKAAVLFELLRNYEDSSTSFLTQRHCNSLIVSFTVLDSKEKEKAKKKRKGDPHPLAGPYPVGKPFHYDAPVFYKKKEKRESVDATFTLMDGMKHSGVHPAQPSPARTELTWAYFFWLIVQIPCLPIYATWNTKPTKRSFVILFI